MTYLLSLIPTSVERPEPSAVFGSLRLVHGTPARAPAATLLETELLQPARKRGLQVLAGGEETYFK